MVQMKLQHPAGWSVRGEGSSQRGGLLFVERSIRVDPGRSRALSMPPRMAGLGRGFYNPAVAVKLETQSFHLPDM